ncbi:miraculin-like [Gastrolobium bilobum]|uniref:miraculin-like n=1 Tax=Gastrolobium bilobum TaxID=150636 RepID=UPI002AAF6150|nr:miraculin-like [Gastrolobium bilobum]
MKITLLALVLLIALTTKPLLGATGAAPEQVVDTSGKKLRAGASYYIVPGITLTESGDDCPDVVTADDFQGIPWTFLPVNTKKGVVRVSTDLNIYSSADIDCSNTVWKLDDYNSSTRQRFVDTGGVLGNPGSQTIRSWFKIEKYEDGYKLVYCPSVCKDCNHPCGDIGIYQDQNIKRLALSYVPFTVKFQQA